MTHDKVEDIPDEEWDRTLAVNLSAFFYLTKAAPPRTCGRARRSSGPAQSTPTLRPPTLLPYDVTKAGIAKHDRRACPAARTARHPRPTAWHQGPYLDAAHPLNHACRARAEFRVLGRARPPRPAPPRVAPAYVLLASDEASYISPAPASPSRAASPSCRAVKVTVSASAAPAGSG